METTIKQLVLRLGRAIAALHTRIGSQTLRKVSPQGYFPRLPLRHRVGQADAKGAALREPPYPLYPRHEYKRGSVGRIAYLAALAIEEMGGVAVPLPMIHRMTI